MKIVFHFYYKLKVYFSISFLPALFDLVSISLVPPAAVVDEKSEKAVSSAWTNQRQSRLSWRHFLSFQRRSENFSPFYLSGSSNKTHPSQVVILTQAQTTCRVLAEMEIAEKKMPGDSFWRVNELELQIYRIYFSIQSWLDSSCTVLFGRKLIFLIDNRALSVIIAQHLSIRLNRAKCVQQSASPTWKCHDVKIWIMSDPMNSAATC